jgi:hypothetical protein
MGVVLLLISIVLFVITAPIGFVSALVYSLFTGWGQGIGRYCLQIAVSIDQLGNVVMQHLLNLLRIKRGWYKFGNRDETISSVLGKNKQMEKLTIFGRMISGFLDLIDPDHTLNSIDYHIEPDIDIS